MIVEKLVRDPSTARTPWMLLILVSTLLFFWKILFTHQFSILLDYESANQTYAWYHFAAASVKGGVPPLWDPYTHSGRSFVGEMQTGLFYPLKLFLYLWPFNRSGLFSPQLLHLFYVFTHLLAACFMFLLAEEVGLSGFSALVAALCFSLAGFVGRIGWTYMLDSAIWLPLILLFLIRALRSGSLGRGILNACLAGLALGMAILAGSLHVVMMDVLVILSAGLYLSFQVAPKPASPAERFKRKWVWGLAVVILVGVVALAAGAIQLVPSVEYSGLALRYLGSAPPLPAREKIPYADLSDEFWPRSLLGFLLGSPFPGGSIGTGEVSPYFGILPLLLVVLGIWRNWHQPWVRYLTALAALSFFYTLGPFSFLHGLAYSLVPSLWMAREAGRFIYCTHFAMALLAGFGAQSLFAGQAGAGESLAGLARTLKWVVIAAAIGLGIPGFYGKPEVNEWAYFSFLLILASYGLFAYVIRGHATRAARFLLVTLILTDLQAFHWTIRNKMQERKSGRDHLDVLLGCRSLANFLRSQPGLFRVHLQMDQEPNIGDLYGVQTTGGRSATLLEDYEHFRAVPRANDLLNVRFLVRNDAAGGAKPVYEDGAWKVYENSSYCPRAWVVSRVAVETSRRETLRRIAEPGFEPLRIALVEEPLSQLAGAPPRTDSQPDVAFDQYRAGRIEIRARSPGSGLLVLSEVDYPGWQATINGEATRIYKVNGLLRGVALPGGESKVVFYYAPRSVWAGALLSCCAFLGTLLGGALLCSRERLEAGDWRLEAAPAGRVR